MVSLSLSVVVVVVVVLGSFRGTRPGGITVMDWWLSRFGNQRRGLNSNVGVNSSFLEMGGPERGIILSSGLVSGTKQGSWGGRMQLAQVLCFDAKIICSPKYSGLESNPSAMRVCQLAYDFREVF